MLPSPSSEPSPLLGVPGEVLLLLAKFLDVPAILALRKTCRRLYNLTCDTSLWKLIAKRQHQSQPMIRAFGSGAWLHDLSLQELEDLTIPAYHVNERWLKPRYFPPRVLPSAQLGQHIAMELFRGRWLVTVSTEGQVELWDLHRSGLESDSRERRRGLLQLPGRGWTSCVARLTALDDTITLAITRTESYSTAVIVKIPLDDDSSYLTNIPLRPAARIDCSYPANLRALGGDATVNLVAFSCSGVICITDWSSRKHSAFSTITDEMDELWNGIIGLKFCDQYILCVKTRSLEVYALPSLRLYEGTVPSYDSASDGLKSLITQKHFPGRTFREVSMSEYNVAEGTINLLLLDMLHGLYLYRVCFKPVLQIIQLGEHGLVPKEGFVGTLVLGSEGRRGVWVERRRINTQRSVVTFSFPPSSVDAEHDYEGGSKPLDGKAVYEVRSYDLKEDLIHCTFSEASGRIVLGTRAGQIRVLDCWAAHRGSDYI